MLYNADVTGALYLEDNLRELVGARYQSLWTISLCWNVSGTLERRLQYIIGFIYDCRG